MTNGTKNMAQITIAFGLYWEHAWIKVCSGFR